MISMRSTNPGEGLTNIKNKIMFDSLVHLQKVEYYSRIFLEKICSYKANEVGKIPKNVFTNFCNYFRTKQIVYAS